MPYSCLSCGIVSIGHNVYPVFIIISHDGAYVCMLQRLIGSDP